MASKKPTKPSPSDDRKKVRARSGNSRPFPTASTCHARRLRYSRATARWWAARMLPAVTRTPWLARRADAAGPMAATARRRGVDGVEGSVVLVDHDGLAPAEGGALVEASGHAPEIGPDGAEPWMAVDGHHDVVPLSVELQVDGDARWDRPPTGQDVAVQVDLEDVVGPEFVPQEEPRVAQEGAVRLPVGDVPGQVVVVALPPQGPGQQDELLPGREYGEQPIPRGGERRVGHGSTVSGSGHR